MNKPLVGALHYASDEGWRLARLPGAAGQNDVESPRWKTLDGPAASDSSFDPAKLADVLAAENLGAAPILLALPSRACSAVPIHGVDAIRLPRTTLVYEMEAGLIDAVEELAIDLYLRPEGALGIGVRIEAWKPLLETLEEHGLSVAGVAPWACIALEAILPHVSGADALLFPLDGRLECFALESGVPSQWLTLEPGGLAAAAVLRTWALERGSALRVACLGPEGDRPSLGPPSPDLDYFEPNLKLSGDLESLALDRAEVVLRRPSTPHLELLREGLSPRAYWSELKAPAGFLAAGVCAAVLAAFGWLFATAWRYDAAAERFAAQQVDLFRSLHPDLPPPPGVRSRLESELRQLRGTSAGETADVPQESAFATFHAVLAALPEGQRFRILDVRVDGGKLEFSGEARSHREAEALSAALEATGRFQLAPLATNVLPGDRGVGFTVSAAYTPAPIAPLPAGAQP